MAIIDRSPDMQLNSTFYRSLPSADDNLVDVHLSGFFECARQIYANAPSAAAFLNQVLCVCTESRNTEYVLGIAR